MATQPINYAALADTARGQGGGLDYAALADRARMDTSDVAGNPKGEGTYAMVGPQGQKVQVPFSKVRGAQDLRFAVGDGDAARYAKDSGAQGATLGSRVMGSSPVADALSVLGSHVKNLVMGPYHALTDALQPEEGAIAAGPGGRGAVAAYRAFVKPSIEGVQTAVTEAKKGNTSLSAPQYNAKGEYTPSMWSGLEDAVPVAGPWARQVENDAQQHGAVPALLGLGTDLLGPKIIGKGLGAVRAIPGVVPEMLAGKGLDVPGADGVTPRQQYAIAQGQGVNLDAAQATGSPVAKMVKKVNDGSLGGKDAYDAAQAQTVNALQMHAEKLLDQVAPGMSREAFGSRLQDALRRDQGAQNLHAGQLYDELTDRVGMRPANLSDIQSKSQAILSEQEPYYEKLPELKKGGTSTALGIVKRLAENPQTPFTWSDLHSLRSDLMDITRGPEFIGDRPTGWIKQMTGAVDNAMTEGGSWLSGDDLKAFRTANDIYSRMKDTYDNPRSTIYNIVRAPDGLNAANMLHENMSPELARQVTAAAPDLIPQMQRQTMARILSPAGNDMAQLKTLPSRFDRAQKEALGGALTPEQMTNMENLSRTTRMVNYDDNPSGTAKKGIPAIEATAMGAGMLEGAKTAFEGRPLEGAMLAASGPAKFLADRVVAGKMNDPAFVAKVMDAGRAKVPAAASSPAVPMAGRALWASLGAEKLKQHVEQDQSSGLTQADIDKLGETQWGRDQLVNANDLTPSSPAMKTLAGRLAQKPR